MRYLIISLAVVAFALMASPALADCPDTSRVYAARCSDLPVYGRSIDPADCVVVNWSFSIFRTSKIGGRCVVKVKITGTPLEFSIDSYACEPYTDYNFKGSCNINDPPGSIQGSLKHHPVWDAKGMFSDLELNFSIEE